VVLYCIYIVYGTVTTHDCTRSQQLVT